MQKTFEINLDISAPKAWIAIAEQFGELGQWTSLLTSSHMQTKMELGGKRVCMIKDQEINEIVTELDPDNMTFAYEATKGLPPFMKTGSTQWTLTRLAGNKSLVTAISRFELAWWALPLTPLLLLGIKASFNKVMREFKHWAETGEVHSDKKAHNIKFPQYLAANL